MHRVQKPLVSSSFLSTASSLHFHILSFQSPSQRHTNSLYQSLSVHLFMLLFSVLLFSLIFLTCLIHFPPSMLNVTLLLSPHIPRIYFHPPPPPHPCTCSHSYNVHWCHLSASSETQHVKISISLARTFRPSWIIHTHISAPHFLTPREVLLFSTPSNEIWMAFFILPGMIVSPRWV